VQLPVTVKTANWLTLTTAARVDTNVAAGASAPVVFGLYASEQRTFLLPRMCDGLCV